MIKKIIVLFLLILGTLAANLDARPFSDPLELRLGAATVQGDISAGQEIWYSVTPSVTGIITVETAGRTNTFIKSPAGLFTWEQKPVTLQIVKGRYHHE